MKAGTLVLILVDVAGLLHTKGIITPTGDFDDAALNNVSTILELTAGVEAILKQHGVAVPEKIDAILKLLPLLAAFAK